MKLLMSYKVMQLTTCVKKSALYRAFIMFVDLDPRRKRRLVDEAKMTSTKDRSSSSSSKRFKYSRLPDKTQLPKCFLFLSHHQANKRKLQTTIISSLLLMISFLLLPNQSHSITSSQQQAQSQRLITIGSSGQRPFVQYQQPANSLSMMMTMMRGNYENNGLNNIHQNQFQDQSKQQPRQFAEKQVQSRNSIVQQKPQLSMIVPISSRLLPARSQTQPNYPTPVNQSNANITSKSVPSISLSLSVTRPVQQASAQHHQHNQQQRTVLINPTTRLSPPAQRVIIQNPQQLQQDQRDPFISEASRQTFIANLPQTTNLYQVKPDAQLYDKQPSIGQYYQQTSQQQPLQHRPDPPRRNSRDPINSRILTRELKKNRTSQISPTISQNEIVPITLMQARASKLLLSPPYESQPTTNMIPMAQRQADSHTIQKQQAISGREPADHQMAASASDEIQSSSEIDSTGSEMMMGEQINNEEQQQQPVELTQEQQNQHQRQQQQSQQDLSTFSGSDLETIHDINEVPSEQSFGYRKPRIADSLENNNNTSMGQNEDTSDEIKNQVASQIQQLNGGDDQYIEMQQQFADNATDQMSNNMPNEQINFEESSSSSDPQQQQHAQTNGDEQQYMQQQMEPVYRDVVEQNENGQQTNLNDLSGQTAENLNEIKNQESASILAAQLPSQYDAVIRVPPDGYYDDYFKPGQTQFHNQPTINDQANELVTDKQQQHSNEDNNNQYIHNGEEYSSRKEKQNQSNQLQKQDDSINQAINNQNIPSTSTSISADDMRQDDFDPESMGAFTRDQERNRQQQIDSDNIKLIMADTSGSPNINGTSVTDKLINYTSEGRGPGGNVTRFEEANKSSPRLTFINKDMNESIRVPGIDGPASGESTTNPNELFNPSLMPRNSPLNTLNHRQETSEPKMRRDSAIDDHARRAHNNSNFMDNSYHLKALDRSSPSINDQDVNLASLLPDAYDTHRMHHQAQPSKHQSERKSPPMPQLSRQVTEVRLEPKHLTMASPTKAPEFLGGGNPAKIMESLTNIPKKMKKLQEQQPDKNELMNELLTALDRVKVAIYKLQPLTAKMNAIYRKSVASNTRDMVMDNNKGFYSKRYPPGDFDDSYDRIPTREFMRRQDSLSPARRRLARGANKLVKYPESSSDSDDLSSSASEPVPSIIVVSSTPFVSNNQTTKPTIDHTKSQNQTDNGLLKEAESQIVATGVGRRLTNGNVESRLQFSETSLNLIEDDYMRPSERLDELLLGDHPGNPTSPASSASLDGGDEESSSPMFGYRITIFRPSESSPLSSSSDQWELSSVDEDPLSAGDGAFESTSASNENEVEYQTSSPTSSDYANSPSDGMLTSESSLIETRTGLSHHQSPASSTTNNSSTSPEDDTAIDTIEGLSSEKMKSIKKSASKKKQEKEGAKKGEMKKKHEEAKKAEGEESKTKKEYKKIKHKKGVVSKEKKTMKRDKHIKAHDRGAAKEKALKERTQIEFFEREQIIDDEFEKGKKSTIKAGWQTGHDSKKSKSEGASVDGTGDMSMGGSHHVKHILHMPGESKSVEHSKEQEMSSGKKSNKFEKKQMEAKGKKFKGWREKGYKIITETEFIDRGSLHDSAYKKRDKGASQHHKYKKHEAASEGHHGSMHEHMKKSKKREEKRSKMAEKKSEKSKKMEKSKKKHDSAKKLKAHHKKHHDDHEAGASSESPSIAGFIIQNGSTIETTNINANNLNPQQEPKNNHLGLHNNNYTTLLAKQLNQPNSSNINRVNQKIDIDAKGGNNYIPGRKPAIFRHDDLNSPSTTNLNTQMLANKTNALSGFHHGDRSHVAQQTSTPINQQANVDSNKETQKSNPIHLDIVDNLTGRQVNKTKIGTYDFDDQISPRTLNGSDLQLNTQQSHKKQSGVQKLAPESGRTARNTKANIQNKNKTQILESNATSSLLSTTSTTTPRPSLTRTSESKLNNKHRLDSPDNFKNEKSSSSNSVNNDKQISNLDAEQNKILGAKKPSDNDQNRFIGANDRRTAIEKLLELLQTQQQQHNQQRLPVNIDPIISQIKQNLNDQKSNHHQPNLQDAAQQRRQFLEHQHMQNNVHQPQNQQHNYQGFGLMNPTSILASAEIMQNQGPQEMKLPPNLLTNSDLINAFPANYLFNVGEGFNHVDDLASVGHPRFATLQQPAASSFNQESPFLSDLYQPQTAMTNSILEQLANAAQNDQYFPHQQPIFQ